MALGATLLFRKTMAKTWINCITVVILWFLILSPFVTLAATNKEFDRRIKILAHQYCGITNIHFVARNESIIRANVIEPGAKTFRTTNSYEFWAEGEKYKAVSRFNSESKGMNCSVAFDGRQFQWLDENSRRLVYSKLEKSNPMLPFNPILYPFEFLSQEDDANPAQSLKIGELCAVSTLQNRCADAMSEVAADKSIVVHIPSRGGVIDGRQFSWRLRFGVNPDYLPVEINRIGTNGAIITASHIEYARVAMGAEQYYWPTRVKVELRSTNSEVAITSDIVVDRVDVNSSMPSDMFGFDFRSALSIWDDDSRTFVKTKYGELNNKSTILKRNRILRWGVCVSILLPLLAYLWWRMIRISKT